MDYLFYPQDGVITRFDSLKLLLLAMQQSIYRRSCCLDEDGSYSWETKGQVALSHRAVHNEVSTRFASAYLEEGQYDVKAV